VLFCIVGVIATYFLQCAQCVGGFPQKVRTDCGTENVTIAGIQSFVHQNTAAHAYGTSPANQRIEAWWSFLRKHRTQWWMDLFSELVNEGIFHIGHIQETDCLRFCFMTVIREDLKDVLQHWNCHRIRPSRQSRCPAGIPNELYYLPHPPAMDYLVQPVAQLPAGLVQHVKQPTICADITFGEYLLYLCQYHGWHSPQSVEDAVILYRRLKQLL